MEFIGKTLLVEEEDKKILVIGDLHIGYEENLNRSGVLVNRGMFEEMIEYLDRVFERVGSVDEVVLLGDVKHFFGRVLKQEWKEVLELVDYLSERCGKLIIIKGNHDKIIEPIVSQRGVRVRDFYIVGGICFMHGDKDFLEAYGVKSWVLGHGHPAVKISDGVKVEKYKCFLVGKWEPGRSRSLDRLSVVGRKRKEIVILPSFFGGNEGSDPRENNLKMAWDFNLDKFEVKIVGGGGLEVLDFGKLGKIK